MTLKHVSGRAETRVGNYLIITELDFELYLSPDANEDLLHDAIMVVSDAIVSSKIATLAEQGFFEDV